MRKRKSSLFSLVFVFAVTLFMLLMPSSVTYASTKMQVHFIDVGQGDATLIQYGGSNTLIDTGEESEYSQLKAYLKKSKVTTINTLVLTHPDADHMGGADLLMKSFKIKNVYMTKYKSTTMEYKEVIKAISKYKVNTIYVKTGDKIPVGSLNASVLSADSKASDSNSSSIVMLLKHGSKSFLFMGDAPAKLENKIAQKYNVNVDVLKVSHHGSSYSSAISFIKETSPQYSVICVGKDNEYGHPNKNVLNRLIKYSKQVYRTDNDGTVVISSTGTKLTVNKSPTTISDVNTIQETIIGNINSKVYHVSTCSRLPKEANRVYFKSRSEAEAAGYHPCSYCCK